MNLEKFREGIMVFEIAGVGRIPDFSDPRSDHQPGGAKYNPKKPTPSEEMWLMFLHGISDDGFIRAVNVLIRTSKYFPTPSEIISAAASQGNLTVSQAWEQVEKEINRCCGLPDMYPEFPSKNVALAVMAMGGLDAIWNNPKDRCFVRLDFIKIYTRLISEEVHSLPGGGDVKRVEGK